MKKIFLFLTIFVAAFALSAAPREFTRRASVPATDGTPSVGAKFGERAAVMRNLRRTSSLPSALYQPLRAASFSAAPAFADPLHGELYAAVCYDDSKSSFVPGLFKVPLNANTGMETVFTNNMIDIGPFVAGNKLYMPHRDLTTGLVSGISVFSIPSGEVENIIPCSCNYTWGTSTWMPSMNAAIVFGLGASNNALLKVELDGTVTELASYSTSFDLLGGLAASAEGKLYGLSKAGVLYAINTSNYNTTVVGNTGIQSEYASSMAYDDKNGLIHTVNSPESASSLYSIDPVTAAATVRYSFNGSMQFAYMYMGDPLADNDAPAAVSDLKAVFENGSLSGKVSFTAPSTTYYGAPASGSISYTVKAGNSQPVTGTTAFGAGTVEVSVTLSAPGPYTVEVFCSNDKGDGPVSECSGYAGDDAPMPVENVSLAYAGGKLSLTWDAPRGMNGGYVNPAQVSYAITRYVNGVATELPAVSGATSFSENWTEPTEYFESIYYDVKCVYNGTPTLSTPSNTLLLGCILPPYELPLDNVADARSLLVINNNHDSATWTFNTTRGKGAMCYNWSDTQKGDDYLVLPGARLEKNKAYFFNFITGVEGVNYPETYMVVVGKTPTVEGLSKVLKEETETNTVYGINDDDVLLGDRERIMFIPEEDGIYYFAIKATSPVNSYRLYVSDMSISAAIATTAPAAVNNLKLTPGAAGEEEVTIEFTAPALDLKGAVLADLDRVEIYRGEEMIGSVNPEPGKAAKYEDKNAGSGLVTYTVVPVNSSGQGVSAKASVYVGVKNPAAPAEVLVARGADGGEVIVNWTPVTEDVNGVPISDVVYTVLMYDSAQNRWAPASPDITETTYTLRVCEANAPQSFAQFAVIATNKSGSGPGTVADPTPIGAAYDMPYNESFKINQLLGIIDVEGEMQWTIADDTNMQGITSQDNDGAFGACQASNPGDESRIFTGYISIPADVKSPVFSYYYYCQAADDPNYYQVYINDGSGRFEPLGQPEIIGNATVGSWNRVVLPLDAYKGKNVQIAVNVKIMGIYPNEFIDNMSIQSMLDKDLSISLSLPESVIPGETLAVNATVENRGVDSQTCSVTIYLNDVQVYISQDVTLASAAKQSFSHNLVVDKLAADELKIMTVVNCADDNDWTNNHMIDFVKVDHPSYPAVNDLSAEVASDKSVTLNWSAPDTEDSGAAILDSLEELGSFANMNIGDTGDWIFIDRDNQMVGGFQNLDIPNIESPSTSSFFVLDYTHPNFDTSFKAHSGNQCLAALFNSNLAANDDWAISPELAGCAQTISFYARAYSPEYPETLEVLYSTTDTKPESFTAVTRFEGISVTMNAQKEYVWSKYSFSVPQGAKYFAVRFVSCDTFMIMLDDFSYIPAHAEPLLVEGYNIYRNGEKLNDKPLTSTTFTDTEYVPEAAYVVTAVYKEGESKPSNVVYPHGTGIDSVMGSITVRGMRGEIIVSGTDAQVTVIDIQGRVIYNGEAGRIAAAPGVYAVRVNNRNCKVIVK